MVKKGRQGRETKSGKGSVRQTLTGSTSYNPLDKRNLAESVAKALVSKPREPVRPAERFRGAGIYILYYKGDFRPYAPISRTETPIYVGKAVPKGSRRGALGLDRTPGYVLYERLAKHAESFEQVAPGLRLKDFNCQYLVVEDIFIPLGESLMIAMHHPIWNQLIPGFGNHDPGGGRRDQRRSEWDTVHEGRPWVERLRNPCRRTRDEILANLAAFFAGLQAEVVDEETGTDE